MIVHCNGNIVSQNVHRENWNGQLANDLRHSCVASPIFLPNWKEQNFFRQLVSSLQSTCIHSFSCSPNRWNSAKKKTQDPNICPSHRNVRGIKGSWWNRASSETGEKCRRPEIFGSWRKQEQQQSGIWKYLQAVAKRSAFSNCLRTWLDFGVLKVKEKDKNFYQALTFSGPWIACSNYQVIINLIDKMSLCYRKHNLKSIAITFVTEIFWLKTVIRDKSEDNHCTKT